MKDGERGRSRWWRRLVVVGTVLAASGAGAAVGGEVAAPMALRGVMRELGEQMQTVTDGISREDYGVVERAAQAIADHRQPPLDEKARIIAYFGGRMGQFKRLDDELKRSATELGAAARRRDGQGAIDAFQWLQSNCYACHREFRGDFVRHFYGAP